MRQNRAGTKKGAHAPLFKPRLTLNPWSSTRLALHYKMANITQHFG